ncbi:helix-turn-helix domain-containing protein [Streptomyces sp. NBC_01221]|uniref:PucR family transcriptional regulator n=1 Tax=unclassified Streptomyces TaxID=2593676 RepID=UPI00224E643F|nr:MULTISPECIES: helix-turn-helix domain-containing protein [unclassified Streptomyces]WSP56105.1 helix-turn-helix domain-containing protein [Streptomyces sp. NBC_01241]WSU23197.1 helix-turn-helix domain-containing protein [Streptomyces sp. NBC_01108]MCX4787803.1 helix-turn-helix domain-containing protein [Streptomyces sp. NBC_01221]MCX4796434.1 helix-turn-helix domain-containing protein [Streptomyces sp. NBC_01242]WSJ37665.1 helix-turn-helix domain-containing protein [Streptomyces sp. NBC_013
MSTPEATTDCFHGYTDLLATAAATGRRLTRRELDALRTFGEQAAGNGAALRQVVSNHLEAARSAWPGPPVPVDSALAVMSQAIDALAEGYDQAQHFAIRQQEAARREFIDDLLYGRSNLGRLAERAERFGLRLSHAHAVAVAQGAVPYAEGDEVPRKVERAVTGRFGARQILLTTKEGRLICIAPGDQRDVLTYFAKQAHAATDGGRTAIGRTHRGAGGVVHSYEEALNTLDLAIRLSMDAPVLHTSDLLVYPVLTRDRQAMADLVRTALGPLLQARGGPKTSLDTLTAYFESGCNATETARRLSLSVRALTYRLERIHQLTGTNPTDPHHRYTLQTAVIGARLLNWPDQRL